MLDYTTQNSSGPVVPRALCSEGSKGQMTDLHPWGPAGCRDLCHKGCAGKMTNYSTLVFKFTFPAYIADIWEISGLGCLQFPGASGCQDRIPDFGAQNPWGCLYPVTPRVFCSEGCIGRAHYLNNSGYGGKHGVYSSRGSSQPGCAGKPLDYIIQNPQGLQLPESFVVIE